MKVIPNLFVFLLLMIYGAEWSRACMHVITGGYVLFFSFPLSRA